MYAARETFGLTLDRLSAHFVKCARLPTAKEMFDHKHSERPKNRNCTKASTAILFKLLMLIAKESNQRQFVAFSCISCPGTIWPRDLARLTPWPATRTGAVCFSQNLGQPETPEITLARPNANTQYVLMACNSYTSAHSDRQGSS